MKFTVAEAVAWADQFKEKEEFMSKRRMKYDSELRSKNEAVRLCGFIILALVYTLGCFIAYYW